MRFIGTSTRHVLMALAEASLLALLVVALVAAPAFAGRGGNGGGGKPSPATLGCAITPNPVASGAYFTITGSGYPTGHQLLVQISNSYGTSALFTGADSSGQFAVSAQAVWAGAHGVTVTDNSLRKPAVIGSCSFTVS